MWEICCLGLGIVMYSWVLFGLQFANCYSGHLILPFLSCTCQFDSFFCYALLYVSLHCCFMFPSFNFAFLGCGSRFLMFCDFCLFWFNLWKVCNYVFVSTPGKRSFGALGWQLVFKFHFCNPEAQWRCMIICLQTFRWYMFVGGDELAKRIPSKYILEVLRLN